MRRNPSIQLSALALLVAFITGCSNGDSADSRYDSGYSDGYAVGYNTECRIRATLIEGDWEDDDYTRGYRQGELAGAEQCRAERRR